MQTFSFKLRILSFHFEKIKTSVSIIFLYILYSDIFIWHMQIYTSFLFFFKLKQFYCVSSASRFAPSKKMSFETFEHI